MRRIILALYVVMFVVPTFAVQIKPKVQLIESDDKIDVMVGGKLFTIYLCSSKLTRPVLVPICTPSGIEVNRRHPLGKKEGASKDHQHHVGIFFTVDRVNGTNFWVNTSPPPQIRNVEITELTSGAGKGELSAIMHWIDNNGRVLLERKKKNDFSCR